MIFVKFVFSGIIRKQIVKRIYRIWQAFRLLNPFKSSADVSNSCSKHSDSGDSLGMPLNQIAILSFGTIPSLRGLGVGHRVIRELEINAQKNGADRIVLCATASNATAISFYQSNGYCIESVVQGNCAVLAKNIAPSAQGENKQRVWASRITSH